MGIQVRILDHGSMHCDLTWLVLQPELTLASRSNPTLPRQWVETPAYTVLIEHSDARILWDTAPPENWETHWAIAGNQEYFPYDAVTEDQLLVNKLRSIGLELDAIDIVIASHLHGDHAGNLRTIAEAGAKPYCTVDELDGALSFEGQFLGAHYKSDYEGLDFETVSGDTEIVPGVKLIQTPGHTWGTCSLQVDLPKSGTKIFTSDAVYRTENWGPPSVGSAIVWDGRQWAESVEKLRAIATKTDAALYFGHDAEQMKVMRHRGQWLFE